MHALQSATERTDHFLAGDDDGDDDEVGDAMVDTADDSAAEDSGRPQNDEGLDQLSPREDVQPEHGLLLVDQSPDSAEQAGSEHGQDVALATDDADAAQVEVKHAPGLGCNDDVPIIETGFTQQSLCTALVLVDTVLLESVTATASFRPLHASEQQLVHSEEMAALLAQQLYTLDDTQREMIDDIDRYDGLLRIQQPFSYDFTCVLLMAHAGNWRL